MADEADTRPSRNGTLTQGEYAGWSVRIEPTIGGYLILYEEPRDGGLGYDDWMASFEEAVALVESQPWGVAWEDADRH